MICESNDHNLIDLHQTNLLISIMLEHRFIVIFLLGLEYDYANMSALQRMLRDTGTEYYIVAQAA